MPRNPKKTNFSEPLQAVILAAGKSSRFWPLGPGLGLGEEGHKSGIKLMGRPLIEYTIDSIIRSGITDIIIIEKDRSLLSSSIKKRPGAKITFVAQKEPKGMGNAIMQARRLIKGQFFVLNPYHFNAEKFIAPMLEKSKTTGSKLILAATKTDTPEKYGILSLVKDVAKSIVEKPEKGKAPSDMRVIGIYLLPKDFFAVYETIRETEYSFEATLSAYMKKSDVRIIKLESKDTPPTLKYPWDLFPLEKALFDSALKPEINSKPANNATITGRVHIGKNTKIYENACIKGPVYIGDNCIIGNNAIVRDYTNIEDGVMIGSNAEITRTIIQENTHIHSGFIGDSIISSGARIGAGIITANKKIDRSEIYATVKGERTATHLRSFGAVIGSGASLGINASTMPGVMIGSGAVIGANTEVRENVESGTIYYTEFKTKTKKRR